MKKIKKHHKIKETLNKKGFSKISNLQLESSKELDSEGEGHIRLLRDKRGFYMVDSGVNIYFSSSYREAQSTFSKLIKLTI